jgi:hypothetical protein
MVMKSTSTELVGDAIDVADGDEKMVTDVGVDPDVASPSPHQRCTIVSSIDHRHGETTNESIPFELIEQSGDDLEPFGNALHVDALADGYLGQCDHQRLQVTGSRDLVAVRTRRRMLEVTDVPLQFEDRLEVCLLNSPTRHVKEA